MAEAWDAPGQGASGGSFRPFDREALHATLADALKDAEAVDHPDEEGSPAPAAAAPVPAPQAPPPGPAADGMTPRPPAPKAPNPFGRTGGPAAAPPPPSAPAPSGPRPVPTPRTGPSILAGGISNGLSPMSPGTGGVGGS